MLVTNSEGSFAPRAKPAVEYRESGSGPTVVLAAGSCSTGAAWRPVLKHLTAVRAITTSMSGYGDTVERRTSTDRSIAPVATALEDVIKRTGSAVHLVGHSFGGLAALAVGLRHRASLLSLTVLEAPAPGALIKPSDAAHLDAFRTMTDAYATAHYAGHREAIGAMIDFYGGAGSWAAMPDAVRDYAAATAPVNLIDWESAYDFILDEALSTLADLPVRIVVGSRSHPAVIRANALVAERIPGATFEAIAGAAHFMTATHPTEVGEVIMRQVANTSAP